MTLNYKIQAEADLSDWMPEIKYSVFNQPDKDFYYSKESCFLRKYKVFRAITKVLNPASIIELGTCAGSAADAYLSGVQYKSFYTGYDSWPMAAPFYEKGIKKDWDRHSLCESLFADRNFKEYKLIKKDLRLLRKIEKAEFVAVDALHDYRNCYQDLNLALTARPKHILVDDSKGEDVNNSIFDWCKDNRKFVKTCDEIEHINGACVITLNL